MADATAHAMVESALGQVAILEREGFHHIKISMKASDVLRTVAAYRILSDSGGLPAPRGDNRGRNLYCRGQ